MRIAIFTRYPYNNQPRGGVESVAMAFCNAIAAKKDVELHVITLERNLVKAVHEYNGAFHLHRLPGSRWPQLVDIICGPGKQSLLRYLRALQPDLIHFHETFGLFLGRLDIPVVFTVHGFDHANILAENQRLSGVRSFLWERIEKRGLARHRHIVAISPYVRKQIESLTSADIIDIDNPIEPANFFVRKDPVPGRVFFAGWISSRKNPLVIVRAIEIARRMGFDVHARFAGEMKDARYVGLVEQEIRLARLENHIQLLGRIAPAAIRKELSEAQVFVLPSYQENAPMAIAEAMAAGVPVIASRRCGMPFMIDEGRNGFLVEPDDAITLAEKIVLLLTDRDLNSAFGIHAHREAVKRYHPESVADRTVSYYESILRARNG
jgi:glycosyltransferase involved in cell wall biosynthesis